jgi:RNA polymerase sigma factor (sigma-70 family)
MSITRTSLLLHLNPADPRSRWGELVQTYRPLILHAAERAGARRHDLEDILQSVLLQLVQVLPGFTYERKKGHFRSWLRRVTRNLVIDHLRRHRHQSVSLDETIEEVASQDGNGDDDLEFQKLILEAGLQSIEGEFRPRTWECFRRHMLNREPASSTARSLGISENAVYVNCSRVMSRLREFCELHGEDWNHAQQTPFTC